MKTVMTKKIPRKSTKIFNSTRKCLKLQLELKQKLIETHKWGKNWFKAKLLLVPNTPEGF